MEKYSYVAMTEEDEDIMSALKTTASNHNWNDAYKALYQFVRYNHVGGFSRDNNARANMTSLDINNLKNTILRRTDIDNIDVPKMETETYDYVTNEKFPTKDYMMEQATMDYATYVCFNDGTFSQQMFLLERACEDTYNKFTEKYGENIGVSQVGEAIKNVIEKNEFNGFTDFSGGRTNLIYTGIKPQDIEFIIRVRLNEQRHENPLYAYDNISKCNLDQLLYIYANNIKQKCTEKQYNNSGFTK